MPRTATSQSTAPLPDPAVTPERPRTHEWFRFGPALNDHHPAIRTAVGVGVPLFTLVLIGRADLAIFAAFAAFTGIYGRNAPHRERLNRQFTAGMLLLVFIFAGTMSANFGIGTWGIVLGTTLVAGFGTLISGFTRLKPVGSLFHIFAFGAIASIPHQPPLWQVMTTAVATLSLTLIIGQITRLLPRNRTEWVCLVRPKFSQAERKRVWVEAGLYMAAAGTAGSTATALGIGHNYWAMVAAIVPLAGVTTLHRIGRGVNRVLGTSVGLVLTYAILLIGLVPWQLVLVIALLQFLAEMFIARQYSLAQVFVTPLALMSTELASSHSPGTLIQDRALETLIGSVVGIAVVVGMHYMELARNRPLD